MARHISDLGIPLWVRHVLFVAGEGGGGGEGKQRSLSGPKNVGGWRCCPYHTP